MIANSRMDIQVIPTNWGSFSFRVIRWAHHKPVLLTVSPGIYKTENEAFTAGLRDINKLRRVCNKWLVSHPEMEMAL